MTIKTFSNLTKPDDYILYTFLNKELKDNVSKFWQVPTLLLTLVSGIFVAIFYSIPNHIFAISVITTFGLLLCFTMYINLRSSITNQINLIKIIKLVRQKIVGVDDKVADKLLPKNLYSKPMTLQWFLICILAMFTGLYGALIYKIVKWFILFGFKNNTKAILLTLRF